jgi:hypothetical protein
MALMASGCSKVIAQVIRYQRVAKTRLPCISRTEPKFFFF